MKSFNLMLHIVVFAFCMHIAYSKYNVNKVFESIFHTSTTSAKPKNTVQFSFNNCGPSTDPFTVSNLAVQPDPVKLPGIYQKYSHSFHLARFFFF